MTKIQIEEQKQRFETLLLNTNLSKLGEIIIAKISSSDNFIDCFNFVNRYLKLYGKIKHSCYHPESMKFYGCIIQHNAINTYFSEKVNI